jgi:hypothetical protein
MVRSLVVLGLLVMTPWHGASAEEKKKPYTSGNEVIIDMLKELKEQPIVQQQLLRFDKLMQAEEKKKPDTSEHEVTDDIVRSLRTPLPPVPVPAQPLPAYRYRVWQYGQPPALNNPPPPWPRQLYNDSCCWPPWDKSCCFNFEGRWKD